MTLAQQIEAFENLKKEILGELGFNEEDHHDFVIMPKKVLRDVEDNIKVLRTEKEGWVVVRYNYAHSVKDVQGGVLVTWENLCMTKHCKETIGFTHHFFTNVGSK